MKLCVSILLVLIAHLSFCQGRSTDFSDIDWRVQYIDAAAPDTLAKQLTANYTTDLEKVRSIFRWITEHISYKVRSYSASPRFYYKPYIAKEVADTAALLKPLNERVAENVLESGEAVCDGYARLFKTLCDDAGLRSEVITGYAKTNINRVSDKFRANHTWNAVYIDSSWNLLDVTWASGYVTYGNEYIKDFDESYFLTPPKNFIRDHYPEDPRWTLLTSAENVEEFKHTPFKYSGYIKYPILSFAPGNGVIEAAVGDSISIELETNDAKKSLLVSDSLYYDSALFLQVGRQDSLRHNCIVSGRKVRYTYMLTSPAVEWLYVIYNDEVIMRYKLAIKKNYTAAK